MTTSFWDGRKILLTGHSGFKGGWLSVWLQHLGADVTGYSIGPPTAPSLYEALKLADQMHSVYGDVKDLNALHAALASAKPNIVFHLAAQPLVRRSYLEPIETFTTNILGTANLLEAVRHCPSVGAVVVITTDKCYENKEWVWSYRENDSLGGSDPYSASKACVELVTTAYRRSYFSDRALLKRPVAVATARAGNVIGGGDWSPDRLIPDILAAFTDNRPVEIRNPNSVRPWQHVLEPLYGYLLLAENLIHYGDTFSEAWNFGPADQDTRPVKWIAAELQKMWPGPATWITGSANSLHETDVLALNSAKARSRLKWTNTWDLRTALAKTIEWHQAWQCGTDMIEITRRQIAEFELQRDAQAQ